jgi:hypothetical protein
MPTTKSFEHVIRFYRPPGGAQPLPLLTLTLIQRSGSRVGLSLLFDTGASTTTLRHDLYPLLGLTNWDSGQPVQVSTAGGAQSITAYRYQARFELLGKPIDCPVHLQVLPRNPLYVGLFGREDIFDLFGFGFWESTAELLVTGTP